MQQRQKSSVFQAGLTIFLVGILLQVVMRFGFLLVHLANVAVIVGVILLIVGLVTPNRRL